MALKFMCESRQVSKYFGNIVYESHHEYLGTIVGITHTKVSICEWAPYITTKKMAH